ncbi:hypothetical protein [Amycolatopsis alkalitolerans]|uniref:Uncharacterized protein n=1 Tax=Amycolatopsis alkalitolerans TaxID=2547244 RepID=A0A5C4M265_9PSEU|nr:hypothetical protein [Amycolatopsis alkalitolerans]TNC23893.1 hypothetical protein FG385_19515 [Amycolatopsis alkalitolerans]
MREDAVIVDCGRCVVRGIRCADCAVSVLLNAPPSLEWDEEELAAIEVLAEGGLIPRLALEPMTGRPQERAA